MSQHDFSSIYIHYPEVISQMEVTFTSHQFILELARQNQKEYVEALYSYRNSLHTGVPAPFLMVHKELAKHLSSHPELVEQIRKDAPSVNIFGQEDTCAEWRKV